MTTQNFLAKEFWIKTELTAVNSLIADYNGYARKEVDLAEMYDEDANDFMQALSYFRQSDAEALADHICKMDTAPRESIVMAFVKDCGSNFVESVLGWSVR